MHTPNDPTDPKKGDKLLADGRMKTFVRREYIEVGPYARYTKSVGHVTDDETGEAQVIPWADLKWPADDIRGRNCFGCTHCQRHANTEDLIYCTLMEKNKSPGYAAGCSFFTPSKS